MKHYGIKEAEEYYWQRRLSGVKALRQEGVRVSGAVRI
jgi:hypothetical protein